MKDCQRCTYLVYRDWLGLYRCERCGWKDDESNRVLPITIRYLISDIKSLLVLASVFGLFGIMFMSILMLFMQ